MPGINSLIIKKVVVHLEKILTHPILGYETILGHDGNLAILFFPAHEADGKTMTEYLFQTTYGMGSTTHGTEKLKTVQNINGRWAVFLREDQISNYHLKAILIPSLLEDIHPIVSQALIQHEIIESGNDGQQTLKLLVNNEDAGKRIVDHLFQSPYHLGSTTHGVETRKTVQKISEGTWAIFVRHDQLYNYHQIKTIPVIMIDLRDFLEVCSIKQHILLAMATKYPDKYEKGAIVQYHVLSDAQGQKLRITIKNNKLYAEDLLAYFKYYISNESCINIQTLGDCFYFDLNASDVFSCFSKIQINGLYHQHSFDTVMDRLVFQNDLIIKENIKKNNRYDELFTLAVRNILGHQYYHGSPDKPYQKITLSMIEDYLTKELRLTAKPTSNIDVEDVLAKKLIECMQAESLVTKTVSRVESNPNVGFYFQLNRLHDPGADRSVHNLRMWHLEKSFTRNRDEKYFPHLGVWYAHPKTGIPLNGHKPHKLHTKCTACVLSTQEIGALKTFALLRSSDFSFLHLMFELPKCDFHFSYSFSHDAGTNERWWYKQPPIDIGQLSEHDKIVVTSTIPRWMQATTTLSKIREQNRQMQRQWEGSGVPQNYNEILVGLPKEHISSIGACYDTRSGRLNALVASYEVKFKFNLDHTIPVLITPAGQKHKLYPYAQRFSDMLEVLSGRDVTFPSNPLFKTVFNEHYKYHSGKITDPGFMLRVRNAHLALNSNPNVEIKIDPVLPPPMPVPPPPPPPMRVIYRSMSGKTGEVFIQHDSTIDELRQKIAAAGDVGALDQIRLLVRGKQLEDGKRIFDYSLVPDELIFIILKMRGD